MNKKDKLEVISEQSGNIVIPRDLSERVLDYMRSIYGDAPPGWKCDQLDNDIDTLEALLGNAEFDTWMQNLRNIASDLDEHTMELPSPWFNHTVGQSIANEELWIDRFAGGETPEYALSNAIKYSKTVCS